jgi:formylglycine-generating enzyme required for sulfatase activity
MRSLLLALCAALVCGAEPVRGLKPLNVVDETGATVSFTSHRALIIGNSAYAAGWDPLPGVKPDVVAVQAALERHGFAVQVAMDLTKARMGEVIDTFVAEHGQDEGGRVVVYYAGHGHTTGNVGYLVPVDAPKPSERLFSAKAYPIVQLKIKAQEIRARHALFACDACFSGSVFTPMRGASEYVLSSAREPVRMFMTAGAADETVPDQSFFRAEFIAGIDGRADANRDGWVTGSELATYVKQTVRDRAGAMGKKLTPQAGVSEQEGFNRGDFVFQVPGQAPAAATAVAAPRAGAFDTGDLERQAQAQRQAAAFQKEMDAAFAKAQALDGDASLGAELKREAWQRFITAFAADNPFSDADERLRREAQARLAAHSGGAAAAPAATVPAAAGRPAWAADAGRDAQGGWADLQINGARLRLRWIPPGRFTMGSPEDEAGRDADEFAHPVEIAQGFWLSDSEVTQAFWSRVMGSSKCRFAGDDLPVEQVSWQECRDFCMRLGLLQPGLKARLPSEAEWEYACRAGGAVQGLADTAWFADNSGRSSHPVRRKAPNAWGLYDMQGNVAEWTADTYAPYPGAPPVRVGLINRIALQSGYVFRGGSWDDRPGYCRPADRDFRPSASRLPSLGLRLAVGP